MVRVDANDIPLIVQEVLPVPFMFSLKKITVVLFDGRSVKIPIDQAFTRGRVDREKAERYVKDNLSDYFPINPFSLGIK
jgi:hypothetical protein